jgi:hypothetical protein
MNTTQTNQMSITQKLKKISWGVILFFVLIATYQTCKTSKKVSALSLELQAKMDSLATKQEMNNAIQIEGFRISKRMLYDNNAIIRTTIRPDDRMNQYDEEIKKIEARK